MTEVVPARGMNSDDGLESFGEATIKADVGGRSTS